MGDRPGASERGPEPRPVRIAVSTPGRGLGVPAPATSLPGCGWLPDCQLGPAPAAESADWVNGGRADWQASVARPVTIRGSPGTSRVEHMQGDKWSRSYYKKPKPSECALRGRAATGHSIKRVVWAAQKRSGVHFLGPLPRARHRPRRAVPRLQHRRSTGRTDGPEKFAEWRARCLMCAAPSHQRCGGGPPAATGATGGACWSVSRIGRISPRR